jgi:hypothetical protein
MVGAGIGKTNRRDGIVGQYVSGSVVQLFRKDRLMRRRSLRSREQPALAARGLICEPVVHGTPSGHRKLWRVQPAVSESA